MNKTTCLSCLILTLSLASCGDNTLFSNLLNGTATAGGGSLGVGGSNSGNGGNNSGAENGATSLYLFGDLRGLNDYEKEIIIEINKVREDPEGWMIRHKVNSGEAWQDFSVNQHTMKGRQPVQKIEVMYGLTRAAQEQGASGVYAHTLDYFIHYVTIQIPPGGVSAAAQIMAYLSAAEAAKYYMRQAGYSNPTDAEALVYAYIRDDGEQNAVERGHREAIMYPSWHYAGAGTRGYSVINFMTAGTDNFLP